MCDKHWCRDNHSHKKNRTEHFLSYSTYHTKPAPKPKNKTAANTKAPAMTRTRRETLRRAARASNQAVTKHIKARPRHHSWWGKRQSLCHRASCCLLDEAHTPTHTPTIACYTIIQPPKHGVHLASKIHGVICLFTHTSAPNTRTLVGVTSTRTDHSPLVWTAK